MSNQWKFKIDLANENMFDKIEKQRNIKFPEELKALIRLFNGAVPSCQLFMAGVTENVFGEMLSFNENETETDSVETVLDVIQDQFLIPFAADPFGNYICYDTDKKLVVFWEHETNEIISTDKGLKEFIDSLY